MKIVFTGVEQSTFNQKWFTKFDIIREDGEVMASCDSAPVWESVELADIAGHKAVSIYEAVHKLPNMCEKW